MQTIVNHVTKRDGKTEAFDPSKIARRIDRLADGLEGIDKRDVYEKILRQINKDEMPISKIDEISGEIAAMMTTRHPNYGILAGRFAVSNLHKNTPASIIEVTEQAVRAGVRFGDEYLDVVRKIGMWLDAVIRHDLDYEFDYFAMKTLLKSYLIKTKEKVLERPQHMWMRVAIWIHGFAGKDLIETYTLLSQRKFTHATPTLFNAGMLRPQGSSCFLLTMRQDSIEGIYETIPQTARLSNYCPDVMYDPEDVMEEPWYDTLAQCAQISKSAGGIGLAIHNIRAKDAVIVGTNGKSNGIVPMLQVFNSTARYVDQGGGRRKGSIAVYLEPWHADVFDFLNMKRNFGAEDCKARDLFYALWISDLFMQRVDQDLDWTLFCPKRAPGLHLVWGKEFEDLYVKYENEKRGEKTIKARELWYLIFEAQLETGTPYMLYKDACNSKSNQQNLGTIQQSNLCTEIVQFTSNDEIAVCNLVSISLIAFYTEGVFHFDDLRRVAGVVTRNLNKMIDKNFYPLPETKNSNERHRPIGVGVQGLADLFACMDIAFDSPRAKELNVDIFETIYYGCLEASCELAKEFGPYSSFAGSPMSKGQFQFDLWNTKPSARWNWDALRADVVKHGVRNSLLTTVMPTASTAQILGNNESIEAFTSNMYTRGTLAGEHIIVNKWLVRALERIGMWNQEIEMDIIRNKGSIQNIQGIPDHIKEVFRTVWEIKQSSVVQMSADRAPFIDQSQSMNIFLTAMTYDQFTSLHFKIWRSGLKGSYYLRTKPAADAIQFSVGENKRATSSGAWSTLSDAWSSPRPSPVSFFQPPGETNDEVCESCSA